VSAAPPTDHARRKWRAAWLGVVLTASAVAAKGAVALVTGSSAVRAETAHSLSDLLAARIALVAVRAADRPPDPRHPFGHQKLEHVSAVVEASCSSSSRRSSRSGPPSPSASPSSTPASASP